MYGTGSTTAGPVGTVLGASTTAAGLAVLPQTGMSSLVDIALAAVAGLIAWAVAYSVMTKLAKR